MYATKHHGFAMILAIFIVVLVALGGVMILGNSAIGGKSLGDNYLHTQADILAVSATEFALMRAQDINTSGNECLKDLYIDVQDASGSHAYDVNVTLMYSFQGLAPLSCKNADANLTEMTGNETMVLIDTKVTTNLTTEPISVHKRTWQRL